ncbi:MAG TPA: helix-turn-helix transcriptional regulator [Mycobacteriales bacterium]|nr:helix-turn-helix transcriptional regulator [Mycobacteriales bacterium]
MTSPTVKRRRLGLLLQRFRGGTGMTTRDAGSAAERSEAWISRVEQGKTGVDIANLRVLLDLYGIADAAVRAEMEDLARGGRQRGWWSRYRSALSEDYAAYIGFEAGATRLLIWQTLVVDGLLQTEDYMRVVLNYGQRLVPDRIDRLVQVRLERQQRLTAEPPLELCVVLDEAVLHRIIGGDRGVHARQLDRLVAAAEMPNVRLQVVPFDEGFNPGMLPSFTVMQFGSNAPDIGYIEGPTSDVYEEGEDADRLTLMYEDLRAAALSPSRSISLIKRVHDEVAT